MHRIIQNRDGEIDLAGSVSSVSSPEGPLPGDPISLGDLAALIVSDLSVMRTTAPADRKEMEARVLRFAPR